MATLRSVRRKNPPRVKTATKPRGAFAMGPTRRPKHVHVWPKIDREKHWKQQDRKDLRFLFALASLVTVYLAAAWKADSMLPRIPEPPVVYKTTSGEALPPQEQRQKQALARFAEGQATPIGELHADMRTAALETDIAGRLDRLEAYLGSSYGLPRAKIALEKLLETDAASSPDQKLEAVLAVHDALDALAGPYHGEAMRYTNDYFKRSDLTKFVFNYRYPDRVFHEELVETLRNFYKPFDSRVFKVDPRVQMSGTFGSFWRPLRGF